MRKYVFSLVFVGFCGAQIFGMDGGDQTAVLKYNLHFDDTRLIFPFRAYKPKRSKFHSELHSVFCRTNFAKRCGIGAPVYIAAVLEYLTAEILSLAEGCNRRMEIALGGFDIYQKNAWRKHGVHLENRKEEKLRREHEKKLRLRLYKGCKHGKSVSHQKRLRGKFGGKGCKNYR